jgi:hypothetical protein
VISNPDGAKQSNGCKGYTGSHTKAPRCAAAAERRSLAARADRSRGFAVLAGGLAAPQVFACKCARLRDGGNAFSASV